MAYCDSTCLCHHNYYINFDVCSHFILDVGFPLYWWSRLIYVLTPCHLLFPWMTMSAYDFSFPYFYPLCIHWNRSLLCWTRPLHIPNRKDSIIFMLANYSNAFIHCNRCVFPEVTPSLLIFHHHKPFWQVIKEIFLTSWKIALECCPLENPWRGMMIICISRVPIPDKSSNVAFLKDLLCLDILSWCRHKC